jgi:aspartyl protease family protein
MDSYDTGRLIYLVLLGSVIAGYFFVSNRDKLGQMARHAVLWGLIFLGVIAGIGLWSDIRRDVLPRQTVFEAGGRIEVPRANDGHYYMTLSVDGTKVLFVVDTGATDIVLTEDDAQRVGINVDSLVYSGMAGTANGTVRTARTVVSSLALGPMEDRNVSVWVNQGQMDTSLLGMAYLRRFSRIEIAGGRMILER